MCRRSKIAETTETSENPETIAFHLGKFFSSISGDSNFSEKFLLHKVETEFSQVNFPPSNGEKYNDLFTIYELKSALKSCSDTAPGEDGIHYLMIRNLSIEQLYNLLAFFTKRAYPDNI